MKRLLFLLSLFAHVCYGQGVNDTERLKVKAIDTTSRSQVADTRADNKAVFGVHGNESRTSVYLVKDKSTDNWLKTILPILTIILGIAINKGLD